MVVSAYISLCWLGIRNVAASVFLVYTAVSAPTQITTISERTVAAEAMQQIHAGNFQAASKLVHDEIAINGSDPELWNLLGIAETELQHFSAAADAFQKGLELSPNSTSLNENLGFLFYRQEKFPDAEKYLARALSLGSDKAGVRFSLAASMLRDGRSAQSLSILKLLEPDLHDRPEYWQERGRAELAQDASAAAFSFDKALALNGGSLAALNGAAEAAEKQGLDEKALAFLIKARQVNPRDVPTLMHFSMVCLRRDLGPDAIDALQQARHIKPNNDSVLYLLARANISVENWQEAYDLFSAFVKRVPTFAPAYFALGWLDVKMGRPEDARSQLEHCLTLAPRLVDARYELAQLDLNDGRLETAEDLMRQVLAENPNHAKANAALGDLMMRRGKLPEAQSYLEAATRLDPKLASAHYKLSLLYFREHQTTQGERERNLAATLTAEADRQSKNQLKLVLPESDPTH